MIITAKLEDKYYLENIWTINIQPKEEETYKNFSRDIRKDAILNYTINL